MEKISSRSLKKIKLLSINHSSEFPGSQGEEGNILGHTVLFSCGKGLAEYFKIIKERNRVWDTTSLGLSGVF